MRDSERERGGRGQDPRRPVDRKDIGVGTTTFTGGSQADWYTLENWSNGVPNTVGETAVITGGPPLIAGGVVDGINIDFSLQGGQQALYLYACRIGITSLPDNMYATGTGTALIAVYETAIVTSVITVDSGQLFEFALTSQFANPQLTLNGTVNGSVTVETGGTFAVTQQAATGSFINNAVIYAAGGIVNIGGVAVTGAGSFEITDAGAVVLTTSDESVSFADTSSDDLQLDGANGYTGTINGFGGLNRIALAQVDATQAVFSNGTLDLYNGSTDSPVVDSLNLSGEYTTDNFLIENDGAGNTFVYYKVACYGAGTLIETAQGERAVETIRVGDSVVTLQDGVRAPSEVIWVGRQRIRPAWAKRPQDVSPVRIRKDALAESVPHRDLVVTPEHCMLIDGRLVPARMLVNGRSIVVEERLGRYDVYHIETARHSILLANGAPAESYLDAGNRDLFSQPFDQVVVAHPACGARTRTWAEAAAPLAVDRTTVEPIWQRVNERAMSRHAGTRQTVPVLTHDPDLRIVCDRGRSIRPYTTYGRIHSFTIPAGASALRLVSNAARPSETIGPFVDDRRDLGVLVGRINVRHNGDAAAVTAHLGPYNHRGWHDPEAGARCRWTDGNAALPIDLRPYEHQGVVLEIEVLSAGPYLAPALAGVTAPRLAPSQRAALVARPAALR
jgi:hypothetical protein